MIVDPTPGADRLLAIVGDHRPDEPATGVGLRTRALVAAMRAIAPTDVLAVRRLRHAAGCDRQCPACAEEMVDTPGGPGRFPFFWDSCQRAVRATADAVARGGYRAVLVSDLSLHQYALAARSASQAPLIVDLHNADTDLYEGMFRHPLWSLLDDPVAQRVVSGLPALAAVERRVVEAADLVTVPSAADAARLIRRHGNASGHDGNGGLGAIAVLPNCVPVSGDHRPVLRAAPASCVFVGALGYFPNLLAALDLAESIGPAIRAAVPEMRIVVAGRTPPEVLVEPLAASGIELVANPPEVAPLLHDAITLVPLRFGGGTRLKILEAFATGTPVISTAKGIEGIEAEPYRHYLPAEDPERFAEAVRQIVTDPAADLRRRTAAWEQVNERYSLPALASQVRAALDVLR